MGDVLLVRLVGLYIALWLGILLGCTLWLGIVLLLGTLLWIGMLDSFLGILHFFGPVVMLWSHFSFGFDAILLLAILLYVGNRGIILLFGRRQAVIRFIDKWVAFLRCLGFFLYNS